MKRVYPWLWLLLCVCVTAVAQTGPIYQADFSLQELKARRDRVCAEIGGNAIAIVQGAGDVSGFQVFRQSNDFYYLTGLEAPGAYLVLDGASRKATLYLPHRDPARERNEGRVLSAEDADEVRQLTGVEEVAPAEQMAHHWTRRLVRTSPIVYTPFSPGEIGNDSRDVLLSGQASVVADPWDGRPSRTGQFVARLRARYPQFEVRDLSPILDRMRLVKSAKEIELIRRASQLAGMGIMEAMKSTRPGVMEYQLEAVVRYVFQVNGARREAYTSITAGGTNAWMGHYFRANAPLRDGDLVLLDYAPDYRYYTSDVTRMWPVNGRYTAAQRQLCSFILAYREALLKRVRAGAHPQKILDEAAAEMAEYVHSVKWEKEVHRRAAEAALKFRGHLSHPVGMAVHDVGVYTNAPLQTGMVFSVDPMLWVPEEELYVRMEDVVAVTETGVELFTDFVPSAPEAIEQFMQQEGMLQKYPASAGAPGN